jgi:hypothetical protein
MEKDEFSRNFVGKMVGAGAGAELFDKLNPEPDQKSTSSATLLCDRWRQFF